MKKNYWSILLFIFLVKTSSAYNFKVVTYDYTSKNISWDGTFNYIPCLEAFILKVNNLPIGATNVVARIYSSIGKTYAFASLDNTKFTDFPAVASVGNFSIMITQSSAFHRKYYIEIRYTDAAGVVQTETPIDVYAIPKEDEISLVGIYGGAGWVGFKNPNSNFYTNFGIAAGAKIRLKPISSNPVLKQRYLYQKKSRVSLVIAGVMSDMLYREVTIKPLALNSKLLLAGDVELNKNIAISIGCLFGLQDNNAQFNSMRHPVTGFWVGISLSNEILSILRNNNPANVKIDSETPNDSE